MSTEIYLLDQGGIGVVIREKTDKDLTVARLAWGHGRSREDAVEFGARAVKACNAFDDLVEALRVVEKDVEWRDGSPTLRMIRAALRKAGATNA